MSRKRFSLPQLAETRPQIGAFLRKLRNKFSLTQEFIAKRIGVSRPTLNKIEANKAGLSLLQAKKLADFYNIPLADLLIGNDSMNSNVRLVLKESGDKNGVEIVLPMVKYQIAKELLVYLVAKFMAWPTISELSIQAMFFILEYAYWERFKVPLLGLHYLKNNYGPSPVEWDNLLTELINEKRIIRLDFKEFTFPRVKLLCQSLPDLSYFKGNEIIYIEQFITTPGILDPDGVLMMSDKIEQYRITKAFQNIQLW